MYENSFPEKRYQKTLEFLKDVAPPPARILDLGVENPFSRIMKEHGYEVTNTSGEDLDEDFSAVRNKSYDLVTAFEIFEHLLAPYNILKEIQADKIVASVPLKLWFASAYRSKTDKWDRHYHEFEDWQFDWLFEKTGWEIKKSLKWTNPVNKIGIRPILRKFTPRYYAVYAERK
ncbi:class I SAM-dependent methyltransferase [Christiangramia sabulilitoris]|uniref:Class I SAM-dependent methyltransferase n=1 Tax=Christiangramia sabulilitoris TaxID=2583991 RepID=A0A550I420_9FLAO|nr:class I SAM-dependent methyltransferase [Christiangramia sabulilitoris]TRO65725.1 class I SAM-dependent methyltransferase [Christiangramia sabulilitoris]